MIKKVTT